MKQINLPLIWDYVKSYILPIVAIILIISQFNSCGNEKAVAEIATKSELLEKEIEVKNGEIISLTAERDFNARLLSESDERTEKAEKEITRLNGLIATNTAKGQKEKEIVKDYDNEAFARYFNTKYQTNKAISDLNGVTLQNGLPLLVVNDLIDGDVSEANLKISRQMLEKSFEKSNELTGQITILKDENNKLAVTLDETQGLLNESSELNKDAVKQLKKMKFKSTVSQYLVPVAVIAGIVAGVVIAK